MQISGTFLNSKVAKRIAVLLLVAAAIPSVLITSLSYEKIRQLITIYEHKALVEKSRSYALSVMANLIYARSTLQQVINQPLNETQQWHLIKTQKNPIFKNILIVDSQGNILEKQGIDNQIESVETNLKAIQNFESINNQLVVLPPPPNHIYPTIKLIVPNKKNNQTLNFAIAEVDPNYLWGSPSDYPSDINLCAYEVNRPSKVKLFCSLNSLSEKTKTNPINFGAWELFMRGEFGENAWSFETTRVVSIDATSLSNFIGSNTYIGITILSLLIVGLLGLIQIRKTMVPLERLIDGTERASKGDFSPVIVDGSSEFTQLANAFNSMSSDIQRQLVSLKSFSNIDQVMLSTLNVENLIDLVITRMAELKPDASYFVFELRENTGIEFQCNVSVCKDKMISTTRISISHRELEAIKQYGQGKFGEYSKNTQFIHERLMAELGVKHFWVLPVLWQSQLCAVVCVGRDSKLDEMQNVWDEFRELSGRISIVISAKAREEQLMHQAQYDLLTGLPNRILLQDRLSHAMEQSDRSGKPIWILFLDLDRFKMVNDSMGHQSGDKLLKVIATRLKSCLRDVDTVARFGGDEFVIIMQSGEDDNIRLEVINRLINKVAEPIKIKNQEIESTMSVGIVSYPNDGTKAEILIRNADIAMYRAKELGRNNYQFFTKEMNEKATKRMRMENLLRKALEREEFVLMYQPKIDLISKKIVGLEALIRWNSPELGLVSPFNFIPLAEETGLILPIGEWVMRTACLQAFSWQQAGFSPILMSVNVSARQFKQVNLVESIVTILKETNLEPHYLELELTESLFLDDTKHAIEVLHNITGLGIKLSIDDFGTGYSSLSYLNSMPLNTLKIDKIFTDEISITRKAPIVDTIIALAKNLKFSVVAEGVETAEQVLYLIRQGCDQIQGYYFCRPETPEKIEVMLAADTQLTFPIEIDTSKQKPPVIN